MAVKVLEKTVAESSSDTPGRSSLSSRSYAGLAVVAAAAAIFLGCMFAPPALMDDVDAVHGQISRNMLTSGDWVISHLDGIPYMEKSPLLYWMMTISYRIFGVHDWAARLPIVLGAILLCWVTSAWGRWAFGKAAGFYAGLVLATCVGLFLFTRILIPDVLLTLTICLSLWSLQRVLEPDDDEAHPRVWAATLAASLATGVLLKGLIAVVVPVGGALVYLALTRQLFVRRTWQRLRPFSGALIFLLIAAPWHVLATLRMPPYLDFTMHSGPGEYHGFFWFYFLNEHVLRFLGRRYPHDYNTVPRVFFWLMHLLWLFPWSLYFPAAARLSYRPRDRAGRTRLLALCWAGFLLVFFTFSTTQEYYSMPIYPALALLLGCAMAGEGRWVSMGTRTLAIISTAAATVIAVILMKVWRLPAPGDIAQALQQHPQAYTLSLGHMGDLTLQSFAYLRLPLVMAGIAFLIGAVGGWAIAPRRAFIAFALMMVLFCHASRVALTTFDPYLSSRALADALRKSSPGELVIDGEYYSFSSVFFYADRTALLLNGRRNNLEYGSYAPGAPSVFIDDARFRELWSGPSRYYLLTDQTRLAHVNELAGPEHLYRIAESGGKFLFTNSAPGTASGSAELRKGASW
ncbi:MAG TPA: glycosyltransferase family 39 protein [Candidatus Angelobacter sp.]|nr:glycosyltransferase family 39 protein [Candidatus Angelobacter sp.]